MPEGVTTAPPVDRVSAVMMAEARGRPWWLSVAHAIYPFVVVLLAWEIVAKLGIFPPRLFPPLEEIAAAFVRLTCWASCRIMRARPCCG